MGMKGDYKNMGTKCSTMNTGIKTATAPVKKTGKPKEKKNY